MPEQLSKHPQVTLEVLASAGAQCGRGAKQEILKACPAARFCKLPGGEICVYGIDEAGRMTQFSRADWSTVMSSVGLTAANAPPPIGGSGAVDGAALGLLAGLAVALALARATQRRR